VPLVPGRRILSPEAIDNYQGSPRNSPVNPSPAAVAVGTGLLRGDSTPGWSANGSPLSAGTELLWDALAARTNVTLMYRRTGNLRAVQLLLGQRRTASCRLSCATFLPEGAMLGVPRQVRLGSEAAVLHLRKSVSFTPASRRSAGSIDGRFGANCRHPATPLTTRSRTLAITEPE
jgi:hypothetical protein